jgi:cytochrome c556
MIRTILAVAAIAAGVSVVVAQSDPIAARKGLMKNMGAVTKTGGQMAKGEAPYDQAKAQEILATYIDVSAKMPDLFPDNSKTGGESTAAPKIWEDMAGFKAGFAKMSSEAKAAQSSVKDLDSFKASFGGLTKNCGACHETYRIKKS